MKPISRRLIYLALFACSLLPATAQDDAAKAKSDSFARVRQEWSDVQDQYRRAVQQATGGEARRQIAKPDPKLFAERCWKIYQARPDAEESIRNLFWLIQQFPNSEFATKALPVVERYLASASLDAIDQLFESSQSLSDAAVVVFRKVKEQPGHPKAASILNRACFCLLFGPAKNHAAAQEATEFMISHYSTAQEIATFPNWLSREDDAEWAARQLRLLMQKAKDPGVLRGAKFALGSALSGIDLLSQQEAERLLMEYLKEASEGKPNDVDDLRRAKQLLQTIQKFGLDKPAQNIDGIDLEDKPFRLFDYKGKVILLDFWGFW